MTTSTPRTHRYAARLDWTGGGRAGTADYASYGRGYRISITGKPELEGSADPAFHGAADRHNPEDLFLAALSACHMLAYLALCARSRVRVLAYADDATGTLVLDARDGGRFESVVLRPDVVVAGPEHADRALALHDTAHERCFIAASSSTAVRHEAVVRVAAP
jgi:organic hydroperoxide reductase OsmC/OhrA